MRVGACERPGTGAFLGNGTGAGEDAIEGGAGVLVSDHQGRIAHHRTSHAAQIAQFKGKGAVAVGIDQIGKVYRGIGETVGVVHPEVAAVSVGGHIDGACESRPVAGQVRTDVGGPQRDGTSTRHIGGEVDAGVQVQKGGDASGNHHRCTERFRIVGVVAKRQPSAGKRDGAGTQRIVILGGGNSSFLEDGSAGIRVGLGEIHLAGAHFEETAGARQEALHCRALRSINGVGSCQNNATVETDGIGRRETKLGIGQIHDRSDSRHSDRAGFVLQYIVLDFKASTQNGNFSGERMVGEQGDFSSASFGQSAAAVKTSGSSERIIV